MKKIKLLILLILSGSKIYAQQLDHSKLVVGYYAQWSIYARDYNVLDIEGDKLTHIMYAFFNATYDSVSDVGSIETLDAWADFGHNESGEHPNENETKGNIGDLKILKEQYPHLKILISIGGWTRSQNLPAIAESSNARLTFAQSMVDFMNLYPWIDGFDVDWEFPITGGTDGTEKINGVTIPAQPHTDNDHKNFVYLLRDMKEVFNANGMQEKEISISMGNNVMNAAIQFIGPGNEATFGMTTNIMDYCDFVSFFGYDFGGNWNDKTCYNAPLFGGDNVNDPLHNPTGRNQVLDQLIDVYMNEVGIPADKLVMGLPFYGKIFEGVASTGAVAGSPGLYESAPRDGSICEVPQPPKGSWDDVTCENSGSIEFCDLSQGKATNIHHYLDPNNPLTVSAAAAADGWVRYWDDIAKVPYLYNELQNKFISYDDSQSIDIKIQYAKSLNLAGVMIWELSQDARNTDQGLLDVVATSLVSEPEYFDITINFKNQNDTGIQGVSVNLKDENGAVLETISSNADGQVVFSEKESLVAYSIDYSLNDFGFLPSSISFESSEFDGDIVLNILGSNELSQIEGTVIENGQSLSNVNVVLLNSEFEELERLYSTDGSYVFSSLINNQNYYVTLAEDYFTSDTLVYSNLSSDQTNQEITATRDTYSITGNLNTTSTEIETASVSLTGNNENYISTVNSEGNYSFENIPAGYTYQITPNLSGIVFNPQTKETTLLGSNIIFDFQENTGLIFGTVKSGQTPVPGAKITLTLPWTDSNHPYLAIPKIANSNGNYFYTESELSGYNTITKLKLETWENNEITFYPSDLANIPITASPQEFNFNSQPVNPIIEINGPNQDQIANTFGADVLFECFISLTYQDETTTISSVVFEVDGTTVTTSEDQDIYTGFWTPEDSDYGVSHTFKVTAESSNGGNLEKSFQFTLNCSGADCPNLNPTLSLSNTNTNVNQNSGFESFPIEVTASDTDGSITSVTITIDGETNAMTEGQNNNYTFNFTPTNHQQYPFTITASDNTNGESTINGSFNVTNSEFIPLPSGNIVLGYAHSWENSGAPFLYFNEMVNTNYNVIMYSFIETVGQNGYSPQLTVNSNRYLTDGGYNSQLLKDDINSLRDQGIPVIVSIGGQNGHVELATEAEKEEFVEGLIEIVDEFGFDGIDLDFEGSSMNFDAGSLTDFSYSGISSYPKLKNVVDAFKEIKQHYGDKFILTCAPETFYVQVGKQNYNNLSGSFLPVIHNLRNELDLVMVQLYNTGSIVGLDGVAYSQASSDFLTSMTDMLITGFDVANTGFTFSGLPASKILVGIPSCPSAAPAGGYLEPSEVIKSLNYLRYGTDFPGRNYSLQNGPSPNLRGVMTWSVNWDAATNCASSYEFADSYASYFNQTSEPIISGCMDPLGCNYNSIATIDDESCEFADENYECDGSCTTDTNANDICDELEVQGCTDSNALNYDASANIDDNSCTFENNNDDCTISVREENIPMHFPQGWVLFGYTCIEPMDVEEALSSISEKVIVVKNTLGNIYLPDYEFNGIGQFEFSKGYQIKTTEEITDFYFCPTYIRRDE